MWLKEGLDDQSKTVLTLAATLPLLPEANFMNGFIEVAHVRNVLTRSFSRRVLQRISQV